ncbi:MAG: cysteine--tRNA ligase [Clostridia bacterium]|nr:cysteine--tRNA ligase [Clostridia bacterium]
MKVFNTLTNQKEEFVPMDKNEVKIYACGPTVYNFFHIGNARPFIIFDTLRRYLEYRGYGVKFVQNFTDVDDKIIKKANEEGISSAEVAKKYIDEYYIDAKGLGIRPATVHPKATENIDAIIELVKTLIDKGYAYESGGDVYYSTRKFRPYGKLSHQPLDDLDMGARIEVTDVKRDPADFALWKAAKPGEPYWESPWGHGRPGWHIECSAMANRYLGKTIDIHCGGKDLVFPHHENEIAQSEAANGVEFAHYWMHNGYINVDNTKMSKSLGNFFTVRDVAEKYGYEPIRFFMLSAHYKSPINYTADTIEMAKASLERLYNCKENMEYVLKAPVDAEPDERDRAFIDGLAKFRDRFIEAMDDDLNTADAISVIFDLVRDINTYMNLDTKNKTAIEAAKSMYDELCGVLGLGVADKTASIDDEVQALIDERQAARKAKNFARADEIRDELKSRGIILLDTKEGVKWKYENA